MTAIKMLENKGSYRAGDIANVTPGVAAYLTAAGYAEIHDETPKRGRPKAKVDPED
jgi:hypothetical protein